jgi:hypothetical protein
VVRLLWVASALLTLATGVIWVQHAAVIIEHASLIKRVVVPVMTGVLGVLLFVHRGQLISGVRQPTESSPGILLSSSLLLLFTLIAGLDGLGR